jgi:hypothetical protein
MLKSMQYLPQYFTNSPCFHGHMLDALVVVVGIATGGIAGLAAVDFAGTASEVSALTISRYVGN